MEKELNALLDAIREDYDNWTEACNMDFNRLSLDEWKDGVCYLKFFGNWWFKLHEAYATTDPGASASV